MLEIKNITKSYRSKKVLDDLSITIPNKSIFGLLGPNGAGKTTLIRMITKIIEPESGQIYLQGKAMSPKLVRKIGYLPEERGLYKKMKVGEQLLFLTQLKGLKYAQALKKIKFWLNKFDINNWWHKKVEELSKGMAQKIQFIATVAHEPSLIILDEPFSGFDPVNAELIKDEILNLNQQGATIIFSTHRMETVEQLCNEIALIHQSKKILDGSKHHIKNQFRQNIYEMISTGVITNEKNNEVFEIVSRETLSDGYDKTLLKCKKNHNANEMLETLIQKVQIQSFIEKIPSINEIFIHITKN